MDYRLYFRGADGSIEARQEFFAADDAEAIECAAHVFEACSDHCASYEVWKGKRLVKDSRETVLPLSLAILSAPRQQRIIDLEELLLRSHWSIARSERLLKSIHSAREA